jgi:hypothetical protein
MFVQKNFHTDKTMKSWKWTKFGRLRYRTVANKNNSKVKLSAEDPVGSASFCRIRIGIQTCRSGAEAGLVSISTKCKAKLYFYPDNFNILLKILKIMTPMTMMRRKNNVNWHRCELKSKKFSDFPTCVKLELGSASGSASEWKVGSGSASKRCRSTALIELSW